MPISIDPATYVISIPQSYLTSVSGTLYSMNTDVFRKDLKAWEDDSEGITHPKTHNHNTQVEIVGTTYYRTIEIIPPYSVTFEDGAYSVMLQGSNNNIWDIQNGILNQNQVQVIPTNTAGGQIVATGSGLSTEQNTKLMGLPDEDDIADAVWDEDAQDHLTEGSVGRALAMAHYNDKIYIDDDNGTDSSVYPYGTEGSPVKLPSNAVALNDAYGLSTIVLRSNFSVGGDFNDMKFEGEGRSHMMMPLSGTFTDCAFNNLWYFGMGATHENNTLNDCFILRAVNFRGIIKNCHTSGIITTIDGGSNIVSVDNLTVIEDKICDFSF